MTTKKKPPRPNKCRRRLLRTRGDWPTTAMKNRRAKHLAHNSNQKRKAEASRPQVPDTGSGPAPEGTV